MADGKKYRLDSDTNTGDSVYFAETDDDADAPKVAGHLVQGVNGRPHGPSLTYTKRERVFAWLRTRKAAATLTVSETS